MNKRLLPLFITVAVEIIFLICVHHLYNPYQQNGNVNAKIYWYASDRMISSVELNSDLIDWNDYENKRISLSERFAYAKIVIENNNIKHRSYCILNKDANLNVELMEIKKIQMFSVNPLNSYFNKQVYTVQVPAGSQKTYFMEFQNYGPIALSPVVLRENGYLEKIMAEQFIIWFLLAIIMLYSVYLVLEYFILKNRTLVIAGLCSIFVGAFYVLRYCLMMGFFNGLGIDFSKTAFIAPVFSIINLVFIVFVTILFGLRWTSGSLNYATIYISFIPWFVFSAIKDFAELLGFRVFYECMIPFSYLVSLVTFGIFIVRSYNISQKDEQEELLSYFTLNSKISFPELLKSKTIPTQYLIKVRDKLQQPLEIIQAVSSMMTSNTDYTKLIAYNSVINDYVLEMKKILGMEFFDDSKQPFSRESIDLQKDFDSKNFSEYRDSQICIYGKSDEKNLSTQIILKGEGFFTCTTDSHEEILDMIEDGTIHLMIIDPANDGEESFELCKKIRAKYNVLQFPILMIINYYANFLVRTGYSVGVNDFVIRPFDSSELISRCYSLFQLKKVFVHNQELARQENEKSTFLYFVTHNVNTPLTLLLNRIEEFSDYQNQMTTEQAEIFRDIKEAINEINEIIQNVLISFRISDGRYVNVREKIFIEDILDLIRPQMESKASAREVTLFWNIPELLPQVNCNRQALRGIVTNLVDNAIKYSPNRGKVTIRISLKEKPGELMVLSVSDEGDGVPSDKIPLLFSRFENINKDSAIKRPSIGLGLYVANELAKMNSLRLQYSDAIEGGACFSLIFPSEDSLVEVSELLAEGED